MPVVGIEPTRVISTTTLRTLPLIRQGSQGLFCLLFSLYSEQHFRCFQVV